MWMNSQWEETLLFMWENLHSLLFCSHKVNHIGKKPYICNPCDKAFIHGSIWGGLELGKVWPWDSSLTHLKSLILITINNSFRVGHVRINTGVYGGPPSSSPWLKGQWSRVMTQWHICAPPHSVITGCNHLVSVGFKSTWRGDVSLCLQIPPAPSLFPFSNF
jgi:hypothetical protein